ncbi:MAG: hypothetical protein U0S48_22760 [Solirubrobacteraceae bacterium]
MPRRSLQAPAPPTAQHAMRQGRTVAHNTAGYWRRPSPAPRRFTYKTLGAFVDMGHNQAVAQMLGIRWRGLTAVVFAADLLDLMLMPSMKRRARLVTDRTIGLFFGRDASELGMLGHPPALTGQSVGGTSADTPAGPDRGAACAPPRRFGPVAGALNGLIEGERA